ncbi:MAG: outer rane efflux protein [Bryobacterales bacterium]|nr:outer rane efflux protein [Bryobacterales bacterium]
MSVSICLAPGAFGQQAYTWQQIKDKFESTNPTLRAGQIGIAESRAAEVTAFLRPNPDLIITADQFQFFNGNPYRPISGVLFAGAVSYLHEREHKRELRLQSARGATAIVESQQADLERSLTFNLRNAFVQALQARAVLAQARENLADYDKVLEVGRTRKQAGDIAQMDLDRLELQRVQFETDLANATVNLRTAKIQLLTLLNDRTPVEQFDVTGPFDFTDQIIMLDELRRIALDARPDLRAAAQAVEKATSDYKLAKANGSADPTFGMDMGRNPPYTIYLGFSVSVPLRIFDRNQGEKARTQLDIRRNERLREATEAQVFSDVDSAYATVNNTVTLLRPYKQKYLQMAGRVRDTVSYAYQHGGSALVDFLQAQQEYRAIQVAYLNLVGSYLTAVSQLNMAVGREAIQ